MKNFTLSVVAVMAISTFAIADSYDAEGSGSYASHVAKDGSGSYVGLGYSYMNANMQVSGYEADVDGSALTLFAGYNFNNYIAVEGRYSGTVGDLEYDDGFYTEDVDGDITNIALYLKPMYRTGGFTIYGLLGYGQVSLDDDSAYDSDPESSFQWGVGFNFDIYNNMELFVDYTRLYDDNGGFVDNTSDIDFRIDAFNFGATYKF